MSDTILIVAFFVLTILIFSAAMVAIILYLYLEQQKKKKLEEQEAEENQLETVPQHIRQRNFDEFIKALIRQGKLLDTDRGYRHLRKQLMDEVQLELDEYKQRKWQQAQPTIEREIRRHENARRIN